MAYKQVTEEEFLQWARQNPGKVGRVNGQEISAPVQQAQDLGAIGNILRGVSKPLRAVASMPEYLMQALTAANKGQTGLEGNQYKSIFLTPEEEMEWSRDPLKAAGKSVAGLGSFLIPGGAAKGVTGMKAVGQAAGRGAVAGTVGGYGYSREGKELQDSLLGTLTGGIAGGALQGAGELLRGAKARPGKVSDFGIETRGKAIGLDPNKLASKRGANVNSATQGNKVIKDYFNTMDELGLPTNTSELASINSDKALQIYGQGFDDLLASADNAVTFRGQDTQQIINKIDDAFKNNPSVVKSPIYQELVGDLIDLGDNYKPSQLNLVREKAREMINFASTQKSMGNSKRAAEQVFEVVDDFFKGKIPGSSDVLSKMKTIYTVRPVFQSKAPTAGSIKVGTASTNVAVPSGAIQERIPEAIGRGLQGAQTPSQLPAFLQSLTGIGQRAIPAMTYRGEDIAMPQDMQQDMGQAQPQQNPELEALNVMLAQEVLNGNISATEANAVLSLLGLDKGTTGKMTEAQRDYQLAAESMEQALGVLEQSGGSGKLATLGGNVAGWFGATTPSSAYRSQLDTATAFLRKALIGSGQSEAELKNLNLPKPTDEPALAREKITALLPLLRARAGLQEY